MVEVGFIGLGKLGLECAEVMAEQYSVAGYDIVKRQTEKVTVVDELKDAVIGKGIVFVAVQTPHDPIYDGSAPSLHLTPKDFNYRIVEQVLEEINQFATKDQLVVLISTCLPGTTRNTLIGHIPNARFIYNPYLIAMGSVRWDMVNPEMVIIGTENGSETTCAKELIDFYRPLMKNDPRYVVGTWDEAEAIKIFYNTMISTKIGLSNMMLDVAVKNGNIDVDVVTDALAQSTIRIMSPKYMKAGMGDSGPCVLPDFPLTVNGDRITIRDLYSTFNADESFLVCSANYDCTGKNEKSIYDVTCRDYCGDIYKITTEDGSIVEVTDNHLIPVMRGRCLVLVRASEIDETDKIYKL